MAHVLIRSGDESLTYRVSSHCDIPPKNVSHHGRISQTTRSSIECPLTAIATDEDDVPKMTAEPVEQHWIRST